MSNNKWSEPTIKMRLMGLVGLPTLALMAVVLASLWAFARVDAGVGRMYDQRVMNLKRLKIIQDVYAVDVLALINSGYADLISPSEVASGLTDLLTKRNESWVPYRASLSGRNVAAEESDLVSATDTLLNDATANVSNLAAELDGEGGREAAYKLGDAQVSFPILFQPLNHNFRELYELQLGAAERERANTTALYHSIRNAFIVVSIVVLALVVFFTIRSFRSILTPIAALRSNMEIIETDSDLTRRIDVDSRDEIGSAATAFNGMMEKLLGSVGSVLVSSETLKNSAAESKQNSDMVSDNVRRQDEETEQVAHAIGEMSLTVQEVARNAAAAAEAAQASDAAAGHGQRVVDSAVNSIGNLAREVETASDVIRKLAEDSENIGSVLDVIRDIAEQTNLLALNAAIEAARAGEQGRGFAVVADEVRTLASRTQSSTAEIQEMIQRLQSGTQNAVEVMEKGRSQAKESVEQAEEAGKSLVEISETVARISEMNQNIAAAAEEQGTVSRELAQSVEQIRDFSHDSAKGAARNAEFSDEVVHLAEEMYQAVGVFKV